MASAQSPEASDIRRRGRQRLIGAIAIAVLLVVFVPMILDSEPRSARTTPALEIPPRQNAPALPPPAPDPAAKVQATPPAEPTKPAPVKAAPVEPAKTAAVEPPRKSEPAAKAASAPKLEGFAVQVGAFKDEDKLKQARDKLAAAKIETYTEAAGSLTRLRVGPFATREAAEKSVPAVRKVVSDAKVVPLP